MGTTIEGRPSHYRESVEMIEASAPALRIRAGAPCPARGAGPLRGRQAPAPSARLLFSGTNLLAVNVAPWGSVIRSSGPRERRTGERPPGRRARSPSLRSRPRRRPRSHAPVRRTSPAGRRRSGLRMRPRPRSPPARPPRPSARVARDCAARGGRRSRAGSTSRSRPPARASASRTPSRRRTWRPPASRVLRSLKFRLPCSLTTPAPLCCFACQTQNAAPSGSVNTAIRPASMTSNGSVMTLPPASRTFEAVSSALSTHT